MTAAPQVARGMVRGSTACPAREGGGSASSQGTLCLLMPWRHMAAGGAWDAKLRGQTWCLPSSGEHSGWQDKERDFLDDLRAISCVGFPKQEEVGAVCGWDAFLLQALCSVSSLYSLLKLDI